MSKSAIQKLGKRLELPEGAVDDDALVLLEDLLFDYDELLTAVRGVIDELCDALDWPLAVTHRLKTTETLLQKLRRAKERGSSTNLARIQDIAGIRVSGHITLAEQDRLRAMICERFEGQGHQCSVKDRRIEPMVGYRAVHVVVTIDGKYVEVQLRTEGQDLWANVFERIADIFGRGIRYGESPDSDSPAVADVVQTMEDVSLSLYQLEIEACETAPGVDREATLENLDKLLTNLRAVLVNVEGMKERIASEGT